VIDGVLVWNGYVDEPVPAQRRAASGHEAGRCGDTHSPVAAAPRPNKSLAVGVLEGKDTKGRLPMIRLLSLLVVVAALVLAVVDMDLNQPWMA
jgi:hypothetical protein